MVDLRQHHDRFGHQVLVRGAMAEIVRDRCIHVRQARHERAAQPAQVVPALRRIGLARVPCRAQPRTARLERFDRRIGVGHVHARQCSQRRCLRIRA